MPGLNVLEFDGGSRGNPGPAAYGYRVTIDGEILLEEGCGYIGRTTNNIAEYRGLLEGLQYLVEEYPNNNVKIIGDSQLIIKQIQGEYSVNKGELVKLNEKVQDLLRQLEGTVEIEWVPREQNGDADELVNKALDEYEGKGSEDYAKILKKHNLPDEVKEALGITIQESIQDIEEGKYEEAESRLDEIYGALNSE